MSLNTKPVIGITSTIENHNNTPSVHLSEHYIKAIISSGGVPVIIPVGVENLADVWCSFCDGIILSSGEDVDPLSYHAQPSPQMQKTFAKRDKMEIAIVKHAIEAKKPILAICRGITMLNAVLGGTVIQHIETHNPNAIKHYQLARRSEATHKVQIAEGSRLYQILKNTKVRVNSMHHQAIEKLGKGLKTVAVAPDSTIEAVEWIDETQFILGVQWHPEEMISENLDMKSIFQEFVTECTKHIH